LIAGGKQASRHLQLDDLSDSNVELDFDELSNQTFLSDFLW
jgi:hypothetical protein